MKLLKALGFFVVLFTLAQCKPVDEDPAAPAAADEKKDTVENTDNVSAAKPADESAALSDSPITDPAQSPETAEAEKRADGTDATTTTTVAPTTTTTTTETTTTVAPEGVDGPTVEKSDNNTYTMKGTTFHLAILDKSVEFDDDMSKNMHNPFRQHFLSIFGKVYDDHSDDYRQAVIIKFSPAELDGKKVDGVIVDFYLRFYTEGKHLVKLTQQLSTGVLETHKVHPLFIRAYVAEPTGMVCTPDCKVQCYSYCDAGCCHVNIVQNIALPTLSPVEEFIQNQQHALKTGQTTPKPCENDECKEGEQQQTMIMPMPMGMPAQMPCQGSACPPMMPMMTQQMPCQGAACPPAMPAQMPCQGAACPPMMPPQMPCQGAACTPPMMPPRMPCQGAACSPMMPPQMPCQGAACPPLMMPPQMPCQGAACQPAMPAQMPCQGAACPPMMPMMPPAMPCQGAACQSALPMMPAPQMCPPSCSQICAPSCPNQCCGGGAPRPGR